MKKYILTLSFLGVFGLIQAQIPHGDFESWTESKTEVLSGWNSQGLHTKVTGPSSTDAVRIENDEDGNPGVIAYVDFSDDLDNLKGGFAYTAKPAKVRVNMKYNIAINDTAFVIVSFSSNTTGTPISLNFNRVTGSQTTFINKEFDISYIINGFNPDSCVLGFTSGNVFGSGKKGSWVEISNVEFLDASGAILTKIPNGDFVKWEEKTRFKLDGWITTEDYLQAFGVDKPSVRKTNEGKWGSSGLLLETINFDGDTIPGIAFTANSSGDFEPGKPAFKASKKYLSFRGDYKYAPVTGDTANLIAILYFQGNVIATAQQKLYTSVSSYDEFSADFTYAAPLTPDSAEVIIASSNLDNPAGIGSKLWVDNIHFSEYVTNTNEFNSIDFMLYPNPAKKEVTIKFTNNDIYQIRVLDLNSKSSLLSVSGSKSTSLNIEKLSSGMYVIEITSAKFKSTKKLIIE